MFNKMSYGLLRIDELLGYCNEIKIYLASLDMDGLQLNAGVEKLTNKHDEALLASNRSRSSQFTQRLHEQDHRRGESFVAFRNLVEAHMHRRDERLIAAADKICRIIRGHGWSLHTKGQKVQSAKMASLVKEIEQVENRPLITTLTADDWYNEMVQDNTVFNQLNEERGKELGSKPDIDTETVYRDLRFAFEELCETIVVLNRISPNEKYVEIANFINGCTQKYMAAARARKTKSEHANVELEEQEA